MSSIVRCPARLLRLALAAAAVFAGSASVGADEGGWLRPGKTIVFLGDSNTYAGGYVAELVARLACEDGAEWRLLNLGLGSETCSGLSEPDHPFPRPCVRDRLDGVLETTRPDVVVICYGMNDGIYYPPSQQRREAYRAGLTEVVERVEADGAEVVLMTPPPFEAEAAASLGPAPDDSYGYRYPAANYDEALAEMAAVVKEIAREGRAVIDVRAALLDLVERQRSEDDSFRLTGDGIHFGPAGHARIARALLESAGLEKALQRRVTEENQQRAREATRLLRDAYLAAAGHTHPGLRSDGPPVAEAEERAAALLSKIAAACP